MRIEKAWMDMVLKTQVCMLAALCSISVFANAVETVEPSKDDAPLAVKIGYDKTTGKYDQSAYSVTSINSLTLSYDWHDYSFDVALPYVRQSGPGRLIAIAGRSGVVTIGPDQKASGKGDVTAGITRYLLTEEDQGVDLDVGATMKFATASSSKGLGSGKNDLALQAIFSRSAGPFNLSATLGYTFVGKPADQNFRNALYSSLDVSFGINKTTSIGVTYSDGGRVVDGLPASRDLTFYVNFKPYKGYKVEVYTISGRSTQSPDRGSGVTATMNF